ncbi:MAG: hydroxyethylthiazole kinase [Desulfovibrio sp.]|uniref:hydroxyethylthiazole kinase n=1 Tax=Desulfovibrio sp. 7SRBS1 TaxID=3378064 RepID=UPI003B3EF176
MHDFSQGVWDDLCAIREKAPVIHNITNFVVMNTTANALLALGASPVMAHAEEEMDEMVAIASALVINIGTLSRPWISSMRRAGLAAREKGIPVVLDPVGAGATCLRTETSLAILNEVSPGIVRGNASEIMAVAHAAGLSEQEASCKGVDSAHDTEAAVRAAKLLAHKYACIVVVSGAFDLITDGERSYRIMNGDQLMPLVTGMGCTATTVVGAFASVNPSGLEAAAHGMAFMGMAGETAAVQAHGPGTLQLHFLDALYSLKEADIREMLRMDSDGI